LPRRRGAQLGGEAADVPAVSDADLHAGYTAALAIAAVDGALERPKSIGARALAACGRVLEAALRRRALALQPPAAHVRDAAAAG
jgi:hypothetical protein